MTINKTISTAMMTGRGGRGAPQLGAAIVLLGGILASAPSHAGMQVCNKTGNTKNVAIGYQDGGQWISRGWYIVHPGACSVAVGGDLRNRYYYIRVQTSDGRAWLEGDYYFCTQSAAFNIRGDERCKARGYVREGFAEVDTGEAANYTANLTQ